MIAKWIINSSFLIKVQNNCPEPNRASGDGHVIVGTYTLQLQFSANTQIPLNPYFTSRSEACLLGMQAAPSSIPTFVRGDLVMKTFLRQFSLFL